MSSWVEATMSIRARNRRGEGSRLREELVEAAGRVIDLPAPDQPLSLRAVAREAGVAPQSVYLHFQDKGDLLQALVERRFAELDELLDVAVAQETDPVEALRGLCLAYCRFGLNHIGRYRVLFDSRVTAVFGSYERSPGVATFGRLERAVAGCGVDDTIGVAQGIWTGLHGIVTLRWSKPGFPWRTPEEMVDRLLAGLV
jgi:AcrR family transcriptional regulator